MKTTQYNPSPLEVEMAKVLQSLASIISEKLESNVIEKTDIVTQRDNPVVVFHLKDNDGDKHQLTIQLIQKNDNTI